MTCTGILACKAHKADSEHLIMIQHGETIASDKVPAHLLCLSSVTALLKHTSTQMWTHVCRHTPIPVYFGHRWL